MKDNEQNNNVQKIEDFITFLECLDDSQWKELNAVSTFNKRDLPRGGEWYKRR